jgi:hypothetical protein
MFDRRILALSALVSSFPHLCTRKLFKQIIFEKLSQK